MREGYSIRDASKPHFVTLTVVDWIDVFTRKVYKDCMLDSLRFCMANKGMVLFGYVIMSNHLHMLVQSKIGDFPGLQVYLLCEVYNGGSAEQSENECLSYKAFATQKEQDIQKI